MSKFKEKKGFFDELLKMPEDTWFVAYSVARDNGSPFALPGPDGNYEFKRKKAAENWLKKVEKNSKLIPHVKADRGEVYHLRVIGENEFWSMCGTMDTASDHLANDCKF